MSQPRKACPAATPATPATQAPAPRALVVEERPAPPAFDAHGFDPNEFEWRPVARRPRSDGWTPDVQRAFIEALADTALVSAACRAVDMSVTSAYRLRRAPGAESFARAWDAALVHAADQLVDLAFSRAVEGVDIPVFDRDGCRIGAKRYYSDRMMMFLMRAYRPERFARNDGQRTAAAAVPPPLNPVPTPLPMPEAVAALAPVTPTEPHRLLDPPALAEAVITARIMAQVHADYPADTRERYVYPRVEEDHPAATDRALRRRKAAPRAFARDDDASADESTSASP